VEGIGFVRFTDADVVRHPLVARIVRAYDARTPRLGTAGTGRAPQ
jgi:phosphate starvation-inducible PhoH-like protein